MRIQHNEKTNELEIRPESLDEAFSLGQQFSEVLPSHAAARCVDGGAIFFKLSDYKKKEREEIS